MGLISREGWWGPESWLFAGGASCSGYRGFDRHIPGLTFSGFRRSTISECVEERAVRALNAPRAGRYPAPLEFLPGPSVRGTMLLRKAANATKVKERVTTES